MYEFELRPAEGVDVEGALRDVARQVDALTREGNAVSFLADETSSWRSTLVDHDERLLLAVPSWRALQAETTRAVLLLLFSMELTPYEAGDGQPLGWDELLGSRGSGSGATGEP